MTPAGAPRPTIYPRPAGGHQTGRRIGRLVAAFGIVAAALAGWALPASAHAQLLSTDPAAQAVLPRSPGTVTLHFGEAVEIQFGAVRVYDAQAHRVDTGQAAHPKGDSHAVATSVPTNLPAGGYVVTWRVISADSHPVHGAFVFQIGTGAAGGDTSAEAARLLAAGGGSHTVGVLFGADRFLLFVALAVLVGGTAFVDGLWPDGTARRPVRRLLRASWALAVATTVVGIGLQGSYGGGLPLGDALRASVVRAVLHTRYGQVALLRLALLAAVGVLVQLRLRARDASRWWRPAAAVAAIALLLTPGLAGHAGTGSLVALTLPFDVLHLAAVAVWTGGLCMLGLAVLGASGDDGVPDAAATFSRWAMAAVIAIAVSGGVAAWRQVGSLSNVTTTPYGRLVLAKTIGFAAVLVIASWSRRLVHGDLALPFGRRSTRAAPPTSVTAPVGSPATALANGDGPATDDVPVTTIPGRLSSGPGAVARRAPSTADRPTRLRRAVLGELGVIAVVFALTAVLVNAPPARLSVSTSSSSEVAAGDKLLVDSTVQPTSAGPLTLHLYLLTPDGSTADPPQVTATFALPARGIDNVEVPLQKAGPGHYVASGFDLPIRGRWVLQVTVRTSDVDEVAAKPIPVTIH